MSLQRFRKEAVGQTLDLCKDETICLTVRERFGAATPSARRPGAAIRVSPQWISTSIRARSSSRATASRSRTATSPRRPRRPAPAAERIGGPVVVKAQVLVGGRGKAGGIKLADDPDEAEQQARDILGLDIKGHVVRRLWVESGLGHRARVLLLDHLRPRGQDAAVHAVDRGRHGHRGGRGRDTPTSSPGCTSTRSRASSPSSRAGCAFAAGIPDEQHEAGRRR